MKPASSLSHRELQNLVQKIQDLIWDQDGNRACPGWEKEEMGSDEIADMNLDCFDAIAEAICEAHHVTVP